MKPIWIAMLNLIIKLIDGQMCNNLLLIATKFEFRIWKMALQETTQPGSSVGCISQYWKAEENEGGRQTSSLTLIFSVYRIVLSMFQYHDWFYLMNSVKIFHIWFKFERNEISKNFRRMKSKYISIQVIVARVSKISETPVLIDYHVDSSFSSNAKFYISFWCKFL